MAAEAALAELRPEDQELVRQVLETYPQLSLAKALAMLKEFGGV